jgi:hypothetical protein
MMAVATALPTTVAMNVRFLQILIVVQRLPVLMVALV